MTAARLVAAVGLMLLLVGPGTAGASTVVGNASFSRVTLSQNRRSGRWRTLWRDDFNGHAVDTNKWTFEIGTGCQYLSDNWPMCGWGNNEQQYYSPNNAEVLNGALAIEARLERDGYTFTSARMHTFGHFSVMPDSTWTTIRVEAKILLPVGQGLWPAFWMLPSVNDSCLGCGVYGRWARGGEIDILESKNDMAVASTAIHFGGVWPDDKTLDTWVPADPANPWGGNWHVYALEWEKSQLRWYWDDKLVSIQNSGAGRTDTGGWYILPTNGGRTENAPFDQKFHIILNMALGGGYTGNVPRDVLAQTVAEPKRMLVDYVVVKGRR